MEYLLRYKLCLYLALPSVTNREDQPECVGCACPLTVQHIMIDCVEFAYKRSHFFDVRNLKDLFDSVTPSTILLHVKAIGVFFSRCDLKSYLGLYTHLTIIFFWWTLFRLIGRFTPVLALYDPFGVDVPLNLDNTHTCSSEVKYLRPGSLYLKIVTVI